MTPSMLELLTALADPHGDPARVNALVAENLASAHPFGQYGLLMLVCEQEEDLFGLAQLVRALRKRTDGRPLAAVLERAREEATDLEAPHLLHWFTERLEDTDETVLGALLDETSTWQRRVAPEAVPAIAAIAKAHSSLIGHDHRLGWGRYWGLWRQKGSRTSVVYEAEVWDDETLSDNDGEPPEQQRTPYFEIVAPDFATFVEKGLAALAKTRRRSKTSAPRSP